MKLLAALLITFGLLLGTVASTTAYVPRLAAIDPADGLTLAAPAGVDPEDATRPLIDPADTDTPIVLDAEVLSRLEAAGVERVRVREFAFGRWDHRLLFGLGAVALVVGALLIRHDARRAIAAAISDSTPEESPEYALAAALDLVRGLRETLPGLPDDETRIDRILSTLDEVQRPHLDAFAEARPLLVGRLGAAGYARLMDRFAAAERQLNRAWSAAADRVLAEATHCLGEGADRLEEATHRLDGGDGPA